jgi:hypothetical protein
MGTHGIGKVTRKVFKEIKRALTNAWACSGPVIYDEALLSTCT